MTAPFTLDDEYLRRLREQGIRPDATRAGRGIPRQPTIGPRRDGLPSAPEPSMAGAALEFLIRAASPPVDMVMSAGELGDAVRRRDVGDAAWAIPGLIPLAGSIKNVGRAGKEALESLVSQTGRVAKANLTDESVAKVFDGLNAEQAMKAAQRGRHLKQNPNTGQYIGAPRGLDSPEKLRANRARVDAKVAAGVDNATWYDRARDAIASISDFDPATMRPDSEGGLMAKLFSRGGAAYSPQASPKKETNDFVKQYIAKTMSGQDVKPAMQAQADNVARGFDIDPFTGRVKMTPEDIKLGEKTGPYGDAKDPTIPDEDLYDTANDLWHGRVMGYRGTADDPDALFDRGFTAAEHGWLTGENLLLSDRANRRGLMPPGMKEFRWTPRRGQAATWGAERRADAILEMDQRDAAYLEKMADFERRKAAGEKVTRPTKPVRMTPEELDAYARYGVDDAINEQTASITPEFAPGGGTGMLTGFGDLPEALRNDFSRQSIAASGRYNPVLKALRQYQQPVETMRGEWVDNITGQLESNLVDVARPLVGTDANILKPATATTDAVTSAQKLSPASRAMMEFTAGIEGVTRAQQGVGMRHFIPANSSFRAGEKTGARIAGDPAELAKAKEALEAAGLNVLDDGDGILVGRFAPDGQTWNDDVDGKEVQAAIKKAVLKKPISVDITPGRLQAGLVTVPWGEEGSGQVARFLDQQLSRPDVVAGAQRLDEGGLPEVLDARYRVAEQFGQQQNLPIRRDVQKMMDILRQPNGFRSFQDYVRRNGYEGLPAIALMLGGAGLASQTGRRDER